MSDKESISRAIFGVGRADNCVLDTLTEAQLEAISDTLKVTDEADAVYEAQAGAAAFTAAFEKAKRKYDKVAAGLPGKDIRVALLGTTIKGYEDWATLIVGAELQRFIGDPTPTAATARMRKTFLRKIMSGDLDAAGRDFFDYLLGTDANQQGGSLAHIKIPLPGVSRAPGATAHPYPIQVSTQTQEFIQAVLFYAMFADIAAGEYVRQSNALSNIEQKVINEGLDKRYWDNGWKYLQRYQVIFNNTIFQNVAVLMRSHWDWYIRQIGEFVGFARNHVSSPTLDSKQQKNLARIGFAEITQQLTILEEACGINFNLPASIMSDISEMSLVRNLGMHNRWEVDDYYLAKTTTPNWELKDVRLIEVAELQSWSNSLSKLIMETSLQIAAKFAAAPDFS